MKLLMLLRGTICGSIVLVLTFLTTFPAIFFGAIGQHGLVTKSIYIWSEISLWLLSIELKVIGSENLPDPSGDGVLFLFNHQSHFDIPLIYNATNQFSRQNIRFGAKIELFKIPVFATAMRFAGMLPIARENRREVMRVYEEAQSRFQQHFSYVLAPEGTRQAKPEVGPFKRGPFVFAVNSKAKIVPVVISGAYAILPKTRLIPATDRWSFQVIVEFLPPVSTEGLGLDDLPALIAKVREDMLKSYERGMFALRALKAQQS
jgi:1-acyl-sn-glycerol-3-phosphate acyltransferase